MRKKSTPTLSVVLAAALQVMPMVGNLISIESQGLVPSGYACILKIAAGAVALLGFDAVSSASSISISPATALVGQPYTGIITYNSAYAGRIHAMTLTNDCMDSPVMIAPGLNAIYSATSGYTATVSGTPTTVGTYSFAIKCWTTGCGTGIVSSPHTGTLMVVQPSAPPIWLATPSNTVAQVGSNVVLSATASGYPPPDYIWQKGINPVAVSSQANLTYNNVQLTDAGIYTVMATNSTGSIWTNTCLSVVTVPPNSWLDGGTPLTVTNYQAVGSTLNLSAFITNIPAAQNQYKWEFKYIPVATTPSLVAGNIQSNKSGLFTIILNSALTVTNSGVITTNALASVGYDSNWQFGHAPAILTQPTNQMESAAGSAEFTAAASGDSLMGTNYQWYFNAAPLAGQTNASLTVGPVNAGNVGNYFVTVTNVYGALTSSVVSLIGSNFPPVVTAPPTNQIVACGGIATFGVTASGTGLLRYQWYLNGFPIAGATNTTCTTNGVVGSGTAYTFAVVVSNIYGSASNSATLTVVDQTPPVITLLGNNPTNIPVNSGYFEAGAIADDSCVGTVGVRINNPVNPSAPGAYLVSYTADDGNGNTNSATRTVVVVAPPTINQPLTNQTVACGSNMMFNAGASGTAPLSYQWFVNGLPVAAANNFSYSTNGVFGSGNTYTVEVVVTNAYGSASNSATLTIVDTTPPVITILGKNPITIPPGLAYVDAGATAYDSCAGTVAVRVTNPVNPSVPGTYFVTYTADDANGNTNIFQRTVVVGAGCVTAPTGLVAWWRAEGNALDSVGSNNGALVSGVTFSNGLVGQGFSFNGASYVEVPNSSAWAFAGNDFSIELWANISQLCAYSGHNTAVLVANNCPNCGEWLFAVSDGVLYFHTGDSPPATLVSAPFTPMLNQWYHFAVTRQGSLFRLYTNGVVFATQTNNTAVTVPNATLRLGQFGGDWFLGQMDEVSIYNRALTTPEIQSIYAAGSTGKCPGLIATPPLITTSPVSQSAAVGSSVSLSVEAAGTAPLSYQWRFNGTNLSGATSATLTLTNVQLTQAGNYSVLVANLFGATNSVPAALTIGLPPSVTQFPQSQTAECGGGATFTASATGTAPLNYQWYLNSSPVPGATNSSFTISQVNLTENGYPVSVRVANVYSAVSVGATLAVVDQTPPVITLLGNNPTNIPINSGYSEAGAIADDSCVGTVGVRINNPVNPSAPGTYLVSYTADDGNGNTNSATRTVIVSPPVPHAQYLEESFSYPVGPLGNNTPLVSATPASFNFVAGSLNYPGLTDLSPSGGALQVNQATPAVYANRPFTQPATNGTVYCSFLLNCISLPISAYYICGMLSAINNVPGGQLTDPIELTVNGQRTGYYTIHLGSSKAVSPYATNQCFPNTTYLVVLKMDLKTTTASLFINPTPGAPEPLTPNAVCQGSIQFSNLSYIYFRGFNQGGDGSGNWVYDTVRIAPTWAEVTPASGSISASAPTITLQPADQSVTAGNSVNFSVTASGTTPFRYQWSFNGTNISGATNVTLNLTNVQFSQAGNYSVIVSNAVGSVASSNAVLTVLQTMLAMVSTNAISGNTLVVPVLMTALGDENAFQASVSYDPTKLVLKSVQPGPALAGAYLQEVDTQITNGDVGFAVLLNPGVSLPVGTNEEVADLIFYSLPVTNTSIVNLTFGDFPTPRQLVDNNLNALPVVYQNSTVILTPAEYAADVYPRPIGDHQVGLQDWVEVGRMVAGLDAPTNSDEFLRADCAPRGAPDGVLTVADWVQAGRYELGLDPLTPVTLPTTPGLIRVPQGGPAPMRMLQIGSVTGERGQTVNVPVNLVCTTNENAVGLTVGYDASRLKFLNASLGSAISGGRMNINANPALGEVGVALALSPGTALAAGTNQVAVLQFAAATNASGAVALALDGSVVILQVADKSANVLAASYADGSVALPAQPILITSLTGAKLQLSWALSAGTFQVETANRLSGPWATATLPIATNGANATVMVTVTNQQQYYRLLGN